MTAENPSPDKKIQLRIAQKTDAAMFVELFNAHFTQKMNESVYLWRYFESPLPSPLIMAMDGDRLAGMYGSQLFYRQMASESVPLLFLLHIVISASYRGQGLYEKMWKFLESQFIGKPMIQAIYGISNPAGWQAAQKFLSSKLITEVSPWICNPVARSTTEDAFLFNPSHCFDSLDDELFALFLKNHPTLLLSPRNSKDLNWRFTRHPYHDYKIFHVERDGHRIGYLVLKIFTDQKTQEKCGDIVDCLWAEEKRDTLEAIFRFSLAYFHTQQVSSVMTWLQTNTLWDDIGREMGFTKRAETSYLNCVVFNERYLWLRDKARWFVTMADSEVY